MDTFLSCDWGTSSFRLRLVQTPKLTVLAEESGGQGIAGMHKMWLTENIKDIDRFLYYQAYLDARIRELEKQVGMDLSGIPLLLSGMASSSIGMMELSYKELPFKTDGSDILTHTRESSENFPHQLILISGGRTANDVLRGEETLLIGADAGEQKKEAVYIFPGTHSKHILVESGEAKSFKTYMTGEFFDLLSTKSILSNSVEKETVVSQEINSFFKEGVLKGLSDNLLNAAFAVRTSQLFNKCSKEENYHFLSGLLIGAELKDLLQKPQQAIVLVCGKGLKNQYMQGLALLGLGENLHFVNADEALVKGQLRIYQSNRNLHDKQGF